MSAFKQIAYRIVKDSMGEMRVPVTSLWQAQTQRAIENFPISSHKMPSNFIQSLGLLKSCCAYANHKVNIIDPVRSRIIYEIGIMIYNGEEELLNQFPIDVFQTGSGTSTNMNMNEVISYLGEIQYRSIFFENDIKSTYTQNGKNIELITENIKIPKDLPISSNLFYSLYRNLIISLFINDDVVIKAKEADSNLYSENFSINPNDHVNLSQSSNDTIPTTIAINTVILATYRLIPAIDNLISMIEEKEREFDNVFKIGRTHLMDALPIKFSQEFSGWRSQLIHIKKVILNSVESLKELAIGGTAVGTGLNCPPNYISNVIEKLNDLSGIDFRAAENHFELMSSQDRILVLSSNLRNLAVSLIKISNDLRWMNSGPISGLNELLLPAIQPGSSIMPGKVNPVICESTMMACSYVIGLDSSVSSACQIGGNFQLFTMLPLVAYNLNEEILILESTMLNLSEKALKSIKLPDNFLEKKLNVIRNPISLATSLSPLVGYNEAAQIIKEDLLKNVQNEQDIINILLNRFPKLSKDVIEDALDLNKLV